MVNLICASGDADQSVHLVAGEGLEAYLPLADMVDISAEVQRLSKRLSKMQKEYDGFIAKLSSPQVRNVLYNLGTFRSVQIFSCYMVPLCHLSIQNKLVKARFR